MKTIILTLTLLLCGFSVFAQKNGKSPANNAYELNEGYMKALGLEGKSYTKKADGVWSVKDGSTVYSSLPYGAKIRGFQGATPLFIAVNKSGVITSVAPMPNGETPRFWNYVRGTKLFKSWNGLTLKQAETKKVDAVSGATYSSEAVISTVQATARGIAK